jgi:uncharacterized repeat protein (TIGR03803 family)
MVHPVVRAGVSGRRRLLAAGVLLLALGLSHLRAGTEDLRPSGSLLQRRDGSFVGTARGAGDAATLFTIDSDGRPHVFHAFARGTRAVGSLIEAEDGRVLGVTAGDGGSTAATIYALDAKNRVASLAAFDRYEAGGEPVAGLTEGSNGRFYGVTGGAGSAGSVFRLEADGTLVVVHAFPSNGSEGASPIGALVEFADGRFYGATARGGAHGAGAIFRVSPDGEASVVHSFDPRAEGSTPTGGIVAGPGGSFFGVLDLSAKPFASGAIYKVAADGTFAIVHDVARADGEDPAGELTPINDGSLLGSGMLVGVTRSGGPEAAGTVYRVDTRRQTLDVLHAFGAGEPSLAGGLIQAKDGALYGMTDGSPRSPSIVFRLRLPGPVRSAPATHQSTRR